METAHRRIELQSPADLIYLQSNTTRAARAKIDLHFPPSAAPEAGEEDVMRKRVEELVDQYIRATFDLTKPNLSINGIDPDEDSSKSLPSSTTDTAEVYEEYEPFDHRLASKIQLLTSQIEALNLQLANLRRSAPASASQAYKTRSQTQRLAHVEARREAEEKALAQALEDETKELMSAVAKDLERVDEMRETWEKGTKTLGDVRQGVGASTAKFERARRAVDHLEGIGGSNGAAAASGAAGA
ncbi:hypothetical protein AAFC00_001086 [Neodothiora populina]|uniref:Uncharacterized protein n=1 Tax=Neodothiora populina TaxID=2781224 RepID=A0ABR3PNS1_9PEZI